MQHKAQCTVHIAEHCALKQSDLFCAGKTVRSLENTCHTQVP